MTANALTGERERLLAAGMDDYIGKPLSFDAMFSVLRRWFPPAEEAAPEAPAAPRSVLQDPVLRRQVEARFQQDLRAFPAAFLAALEEGRSTDAMRLAHTIKGLAGTLGHAALQEAAELAEAALRAGQAPEAETLLAAARERLTEAAPEGPKGAEIGLPELARLLSDLHPALVEFDTEALRKLEPLTKAALPSGYAEPLAALIEAAGNYDFGKAADLCEKLTADLMGGAA